MSEIPRYRHHKDGCGNFQLVADAEGGMVRYADHEAALAELRAERERLEKLYRLERAFRAPPLYVPGRAEYDAETEAAIQQAKPDHASKGEA